MSTEISHAQTADEARFSFRDLRFPLVARSVAAGWVIDARSLSELAHTPLPFDPAYWQGLEVFDFVGHYFVARRVFLSGDATVDAELSEVSKVPLTDLRYTICCLAGACDRLRNLPRIRAANDLRELIQALYYD